MHRLKAASSPPWVIIGPYLNRLSLFVMGVELNSPHNTIVL